MRNLKKLLTKRKVRLLSVAVLLIMVFTTLAITTTYSPKPQFDVNQVLGEAISLVDSEDLQSHVKTLWLLVDKLAVTTNLDTNRFDVESVKIKSNYFDLTVAEATANNGNNKALWIHYNGQKLIISDALRFRGYNRLSQDENWDELVVSVAISIFALQNNAYADMGDGETQIIIANRHYEEELLASK